MAAANDIAPSIKGVSLLAECWYIFPEVPESAEASVISLWEREDLWDGSVQSPSSWTGPLLLLLERPLLSFAVCLRFSCACAFDLVGGLLSYSQTPFILMQLLQAGCSRVQRTLRCRHVTQLSDGRGLGTPRDSIGMMGKSDGTVGMLVRRLKKQCSVWVLHRGAGADSALPWTSHGRNGGENRGEMGRGRYLTCRGFRC